MSDGHIAPRPAVLIVGCGYAGLRLALRLARSHDVIGCVATTTSARRLSSLGINAVPLDLDIDERLPVRVDWLHGATICHFVPPPGTTGSDPRTARLLQLLPDSIGAFVYLSTTGVYGDRGGATVTEATPIRPMTERSRRRADAEARVFDWSERRGVRAVVLRVPGIYGPDRLPLTRLRRGEPVLAAGDAGPGNRIHVDDLVTACELAIESPEARGVYNVCDGDHASSSEYFAIVARLAGLPLPREITLAQASVELSPQMLSFLTESRRVSAARIRDELGFRPRFASLEAGVRASLRR